MSDGDGDSARQAKELRDHATTLLREAMRCDDPARRDGLLHEAVARLDEARRLLSRLDNQDQDLGLIPTRRMH